MPKLNQRRVKSVNSSPDVVFLPKNPDLQYLSGKRGVVVRQRFSDVGPLCDVLFNQEQWLRFGHPKTFNWMDPEKKVEVGINLKNAYPVNVVTCHRNELKFL